MTNSARAHLTEALSRLRDQVGDGSQRSVLAF